MSCVHLHAGILHKLRYVCGFAFTKLQSGKYFVIKILGTKEFGHVCCHYPCFAKSCQKSQVKSLFSDL